VQELESRSQAADLDASQLEVRPTIGSGLDIFMLNMHGLPSTTGHMDGDANMLLHCNSHISPAHAKEASRPLTNP
jgi:hypothetical protein